MVLERAICRYEVPRKFGRHNNLPQAARVKQSRKDQSLQQIDISPEAISPGNLGLLFNKMGRPDGGQAWHRRCDVDTNLRLNRGQNGLT